MTVFLTPGGEPFFGGTYFPPEPRHGLPAFHAGAARGRRGVARAARGRRPLRRATWSSTCAVGAALSPSREPLTDAAARRGAAVARGRLRPAVGRLRGARRSSRRRSVLEFLLRRGEERMARTTLDGMARGGMYDLVGGGFHRYSVDERWLVPHFEKMLYDNALLAPVYLHACAPLRRRALPASRRADARLRAARARARGRRLRVGAGRRHRRRRGADVHVGARRGRAGGAACSRSSTAASCCAASSTRRRARGSSSCASSGRSRCATTRRSPPGTASRSPRSRRRTGSGARTCSPPRTARRVPARAALDGRGPAAPHLARRRREGDRLPRGLRRRRVRAARAARRDRRRRAGCARRTGSRRSRSSCSPTTERRVLPDAARRRAARRAQEGARRPPDAERQLDARLRAAAARAHLGRRRARAARRRRAAPRPRRAAAASPSAFGWALVALDQHLAPHRELAIVGPRDSAVARAALERAAATDVIAFGPAEDVPLLAGRGRSTAGRGLRLRALRLPVLPVTDPARARELGTSKLSGRWRCSRSATSRAGSAGSSRSTTSRSTSRQGQIVGLIGPNGAGKTTLFNVVTRLYKPDVGRARASTGKSLLRTPPHRIVRRGIARTFQNVELFRTMTVLDNVLVGAHTRTRPFRGRAAADARASRCSTTSASPTSRPGPWPGCRSGR